MENIELITQLTVEEWQEEISKVKTAYPERPLWASIMGTMEEGSWQHIAEAVQEAGADALELNVSCPHGMPSKGMGAFIGQSEKMTGDVVAWVKKVAQVPVIVKLTPNVTDIAFVAEAAKENGADGLAASNTVLALVGVNLDTLTPLPAVGGLSTYGGYSGPGMKPVALRCVAQIAKATGLPVSGMGGINNWRDAVEFMALGAGTVQVCTAVMWQGYGIINRMKEGVNGYLKEKGYSDLGQVLGAALPKIVEFPDMPLGPRAKASVDETCNGCLLCIDACSDAGYQAITGMKGEVVEVDGERCDGCSLCVMVCPLGSISMVGRG
jgi:dihydropyrimidine dehydrogenase (NAD+) subunit PreA